MLDELGLVQVAVDNVHSEHVVGSGLDRLYGESPAVAGDVEDPPTAQRASASFEELRPAVAHERIHTSALDSAVGHLWQVGLTPCGKFHRVMEWRQLPDTNPQLLLGHFHDPATYYDRPSITR